MTSDKQNQANQNNAQHSTGPITAKGLATSSQNARKHGANAKHLVDADEIAQYENMIVRLKEKYPSDNPLIEMQFARIAKLNIQLKRIQQFIDAAFLLAKDHTIADEALMNMLQMSDAEKNDARTLSDKGTDAEIIFDLELMEISTEICQIDTETFKTPQDFLTHTPLLCHYLYRAAELGQTSIEEYVSKHLLSKLSGNGDLSFADEFLRQLTQFKQDKFDFEEEKRGFRKKDKGNEQESTSPPEATKEDVILETRVKALHEAAKLLQDLITKTIQSNHKLYAFEQIRKLEHNPLPLEYDNLDKLFRYQTTIQRQLSSAIGELIYINKS